MGWVSHNDIRIRDLCHHAATCSFTLQTTNAGFNKRIALIFLLFLADFFFGHALLLGMIPNLEWHIDHSNQGHRTSGQQKTHRQIFARLTDPRIHRHRQ